ncbi:hypothetical protein Tco_1330091 [Tanacetum coccineum]
MQPWPALCGAATVADLSLAALISVSFTRPQFSNDYHSDAVQTGEIQNTCTRDPQFEKEKKAFRRVHRIASASAKRTTYPNADPEVFQMRQQLGARNLGSSRYYSEVAEVGDRLEGRDRLGCTFKPRSSMFKRRLNNTVQASVVNDKWCLLKITLQAPFLNVQMTSVHISSGLVLHQMTSDHNRSELGIQDHSNEQTSSKRFKVVP